MRLVGCLAAEVRRSRRGRRVMPGSVRRDIGGVQALAEVPARIAAVVPNTVDLYEPRLGVVPVRPVRTGIWFCSGAWIGARTSPS